MNLRVQLGDIDIYREMNNARYLTIMEMGRWDMGVRSGLLPVVKQNNWFFVIAGCSIRYRKRLLPFQRYRLRSQLVAVDTRWMYVEQGFFRGDVQHTGGLVRAAICDKNGLVPTQKVFEAMGEPYREVMPSWVSDWIQSDENRPMQTSRSVAN